MLSCLRINRKSCLVLPLLLIFALVVFNISQNHLHANTHQRCLPCHCNNFQSLPYIEDSSQEGITTTRSIDPITRESCNCSQYAQQKKTVPLLSDMIKENKSLPGETVTVVRECPKCTHDYDSIDVHTYDKERVVGLYSKVNGAVFIPFKFLQKRYEVHGELQYSSRKKKVSLLWLHSNVTEIDVSSYSPFGQYMGMLYSNVEGRERVKCISAVEGIPVTTQWSKLGYFYPTQIAQFGLSHYSKFVHYPKPLIHVLEDGLLSDSAKWKVQIGASMRSVYDKTVKSRVVFFDSRGIQEDGITYPVTIPPGDANILSLSVKFRNVGQISVSVLGSDKQKYFIRYSLSESMWVKYSHPDIYYGLPKRGKWLHLTRDLDVDLQKGLGSNQGKKVKPVQKTVIQIIDFTFHGTGWFDNITLSSSAHERLFLTAANWLVRNQDWQGGWVINVTRKVVEGLAIRPGWYSAMSQGQAISLLCRVFNHSGNRIFLNAATAALKLFRKSSSKRGIVAHFMDKYAWYEEYPTQPPLFVLNGFMYSLIGLYDLSVTAKGTDWGDEALILLKEGLLSLEAMLPLFDSGFGTLYDLRHVTLRDSYRPPNRARWSYHVLHVEQLSVIRQFHPSSKIDTIIRRWRKYIHGYVSPHN